jgi:acetyl esterase/lipase
MVGYIDPALVELVAKLPPTDISQPAAARERLRGIRTAHPPFAVPDGLTRESVTVPGLPGEPPARALLFRPAQPKVGLVYLHGGGFVIGDAEGDQTIAAQLAVAGEALVVSVDYRLAPEHPFPAAHNDGYAVLTWLAQQQGVDRLAVAGSSAGAGLAAGLALRARDEGGPPLVAQLLEIPSLDDRGTTPSAQYADTPMWNRTNLLQSWAFYLAGADPVPPYAAPARVSDLSGLPPAYIGVNQTDPLRDEGIAYAQALAQHGVPTELRMNPGLFHGAASLFPDVDACRRARASLLNATARLLIS